MSKSEGRRGMGKSVGRRVVSLKSQSCPVLLAHVTLFQFLSSKVIIIGSIKESVED